MNHIVRLRIIVLYQKTKSRGEKSGRMGGVNLKEEGGGGRQ